MSRIKIELNSAGIRALLKSSEVSACVESVAKDVQGSCGHGYGTDTHVTPSRVVAGVYTATASAARDNLKNNTLLKAVSK